MNSLTVVRVVFHEVACLLTESSDGNKSFAGIKKTLLVMARLELAGND